MSKVLVVAVHPDDETLGCGGTLIKHKTQGDKIYWLIGSSARKNYGFKEDDVLRQRAEIKTVASQYDFEEIYNLGFAPMKLDRYPINEIISKISKVIYDVKPNIIYLPFKGDVHSDHRVIFDAAYSCTKIFRYPFIRKILMMEIISETEFSPALNGDIFSPNYFVDVTDFLEKKLSIMEIYKKELGPHPFPRSLENIRALAVFRGATAGSKYAEAFMVLKEIQ